MGIIAHGLKRFRDSVFAVLLRSHITLLRGKKGFDKYVETGIYMKVRDQC